MDDGAVEEVAVAIAIQYLIYVNVSKKNRVSEMGTLILFCSVNHLLRLKKLLLEEVGNLKLLPLHLRGGQLLAQIATFKVEDSVGKRAALPALNLRPYPLNELWHLRHGARHR